VIHKNRRPVLGGGFFAPECSPGAASRPADARHRRAAFMRSTAPWALRVLRWLARERHRARSPVQGGAAATRRTRTLLCCRRSPGMQPRRTEIGPRARLARRTGATHSRSKQSRRGPFLAPRASRSAPAPPPQPAYSLGLRADVGLIRLRINRDRVGENSTVLALDRYVHAIEIDEPRPHLLSIQARECVHLRA
jgi:hypothetical protein